VFDLVYAPVVEVAESFDAGIMMATREAFAEEIDRLKKEKLIKSTMELEIAGDVDAFTISDSKDLEDWFVVSAVRASSEGEQIATFEAEGKQFTIHKATAHKCPRCWRFVSTAEDTICERCAKVVG
jgi:isoleucyl-tRNA synthetase